jgi:type 1 fimbria pilin
MTRQTWQSWAPNRASAAVAAALLMAPLAASAATVIGGGTITFLGMITAPPLQISASPAVSAMRVAAIGGQAEREGSGVTLSFKSSPGVVSGADVALQVPGAAQSRDTVAARFVDSGGHVLAEHDGHYDVGHDGGVLSLSPGRAAREAEVVVVTSYD